MLDLTSLLFRGMRTLGIWLRKAVKCFKWGLMDHTNRNMEASVVEGDLNCGGLAEEISEEKIIMWPRDCSCDIFMKNVTAFYYCPKNLPKDKLKVMN